MCQLSMPGSHTHTHYYSSWKWGPISLESAVCNLKWLRPTWFVVFEKCWRAHRRSSETITKTTYNTISNYLGSHLHQVLNLFFFTSFTSKLYSTIQLLEYAIPSPRGALGQENPEGNISGTKRGIIDLVSKQPGKNCGKKITKNNNKTN